MMRSLAVRHGAKLGVSGGLDSFDWFKDRIKRPEVVIDLSQIKELRGIRAVAMGWNWSNDTLTKWCVPNGAREV